METRELERIARIALRELGAGDPPLRVSADTQPDRWRIEIGGSEPATLTVRAGSGTTAQYIREQIFKQFAGR
jgi:hypothetical protein